MSSVAITEGTVTTSGTASWWAACASTFHARGTLAPAQVVAATNTFTLAWFDIRIPAD